MVRQTPHAKDSESLSRVDSFCLFCVFGGLNSYIFFLKTYIAVPIPFDGLRAGLFPVLPTTGSHPCSPVAPNGRGSDSTTYYP